MSVSALPVKLLFDSGGNPSGLGEFVSGSDHISSGLLQLSGLGYEIDHGSLLGRSDDDHTQYVLVNGSRAVTGELSAIQNLTVSGDVSSVGAEGHAFVFKRDDGASHENLIKSYEGTITVQSEDDIHFLSHTGEKFMRLNESGGDGEVELYFNNSLKLETKDGGVDITGGVSATSGTLDENLTTNLMAFSRPFHHYGFFNGAFANGAQEELYLHNTDNDTNFVLVPGQTLKILSAYANCKNSSTIGINTWTIGIRVWNDQAHTTATDVDLISSTSTAQSSYTNIIGQGTLASPLGSFSGDSYVVGMAYLKYGHNGAAASLSDKHSFDIHGVYV